MIIGIGVIDEFKKAGPEKLIRDAMQAYEKRFGTPATHAEISEKVVAPVIEGLVIRQVRYVRPNMAIAGIPFSQPIEAENA